MLALGCMALIQGLAMTAADSLSAITVIENGFSKGMLWSTYSMETECLLDGTAGQILAKWRGGFSVERLF